MIFGRIRRLIRRFRALFRRFGGLFGTFFLLFVRHILHHHIARGAGVGILNIRQRARFHQGDELAAADGVVLEQRVHQRIYVSATPGDYEKDRAGQIVEQVIRPTGLLDPKVEVRPVENQIDDLVGEINARAARNERVLVTTLTKKMAEDLTQYLTGVGIRVRYMHADVETIERMELIRGLRLGEFDVLVGINLLREGLDIPEVSMVAILDADKEGFLRSEVSMIQTIGRAARNADGLVVLYADTITPSMRRAMDETERRRQIQDDYNKAHGIIPQTIRKDVREIIEISKKDEESARRRGKRKLSERERDEEIRKLEKQMQEASRMLEFEYAAILRDRIIELRKENTK